jgi:hypothetical protein
MLVIVVVVLDAARACFAQRPRPGALLGSPGPSASPA